MSTRLVILALLQSKPLYGYELKQIIEKDMGDWTSIAFGSIYFALARLSRNGFVEKTGEEKLGNRPSRSVYRITEKGREEFIKLLRETWNKFEREYYPLDVALAFSGSLPADEIKGYLQKRIDILARIIGHLEKHKREQMSKPDIPKLAGKVFTHTEYHIKAEMEWLQSVLEGFNSEELP